VFDQPARGVRALAADFAQIRCTGIAYVDIRTKSAAQASNLLTVASMSAKIRCTGIAYADIRTKSAAQASNLLTVASIHRHRICSLSLQSRRTGIAYDMLTFASMSLKIRRTGIAYAHFCFKSAFASH